MAAVTRLLSVFSESLNFVEQSKSAEKSKVEYYRNSALTSFQAGYADFLKLQNNFNSQLSDFRNHPELFITIAEAAFAVGNYNVARDLLEDFLSSDPQKDQYFCRAKLLLARLLDHDAGHAHSTANIEKRKVAMGHVIEALNVATQPDNINRYKFLVYNASVVSWFIVHQFIRPNRAKFFLGEMLRISQGLESVEDPDINWRITFLSATSYALNDDKQLKPALENIDKAIELMENLLSKTLEKEDLMQIEIKQINKESDDILISIHKIEHREIADEKSSSNAKDKGKKGKDDRSKNVTVAFQDPNRPLDADELHRIQELKTKLEHLQSNKMKATQKLRDIGEEKVPQIERLTRLHMQKITMSPTEAKKSTSNPLLSKFIRPVILLQLQGLLSTGLEKEKDPSALLQHMVQQLESSKDTIGVTETLLDVGRTAWRHRLHGVALKCIEAAKREKSVTPVIRAKLDVCLALQVIHEMEQQTALLLSDNNNNPKNNTNSTTGNSSSTSSVAQVRLSERELEGFKTSKRLEAIRMMERVIILATTRFHDEPFLEECCIFIWNMVYPVLQPHLRMQLHSILRLTANALEAISSPLLLLRSQIYFELAKCEDMGEYLSKGRQEVEKALALDYGLIESEYSMTGNDANTTTAPVAQKDKTGKKAGSLTGLSDISHRTDELNALRPYDHFYEPLLHSLTIRLDIYGTPATPEDMVFTLLQQMSQNPLRSSQFDILTRITAIFMDILDSKPINLMTVSTQRKPLPSNIDLIEIETFINRPRSSVAAGSPSYDPFLKITQYRVGLGLAIIKAAKTHKCTAVIEVVVKYILSFTWNEHDSFMKDLIRMQIEACFALVDSLVDRISTLWIDAETEKTYEDQLQHDFNLCDPRTLGLSSSFATAEMSKIKLLIIQTLTLAVTLSKQLNDVLFLQNSMIYFWNLHLHIFRHYSYYSVVLPEVFEFIKSICGQIEAIPNSRKTFDEKLVLVFYEVLAKLYESKGQLQLGLETATRGGAFGSVYNRRRIVYLANELTMSINSPSSTGGKGQPKATIEAVRFDHPFLMVLGMLILADHKDTPVDQKKALAAKISTLMDHDIKNYIKNTDKTKLSTDEFNQLAELQAECWTKLTRVRILLDDIHGAQQAAEKCMELVTSELTNDTDIQHLNTRVWRWISVCERYFGVAISKLIKSDGQNKELQNELRLASMRHFTLSAQFGKKADLDDLTIAASKRAWQISVPMINDPTVRSSLNNLQKQIVDVLSTCKDEGSGLLLQQFYMASVELQIQVADWDTAVETILEAFERVPAELQKPLWKWRVIILSKKGKNVLDGIQKLKESDPSLQARVYGIIARSSSRPKQQLEAYYKAIELLKDDMNRLEYMLETAQWIASSGLPKEEAYNLLHGCLDAIYELDDRLRTDEEEEVDHGGSQASSRQSGLTKRSGASTVRMSVTSRMGKAAGGSTAGSVLGSTIAKRKKSRGAVSVSSTEPPEDNDKMLVNLKHLDMGVRASMMVGIIECQSDRRINRFLEAVSLIQRSISIWKEAIFKQYRESQYLQQPIAVREATPLDRYEVTLPTNLQLPEEPIELLYWTPTAEFIGIMGQCTTSNPYNVPNLFSVTCPALTWYYLRDLTCALFDNGFMKMSMMVLSWLRMIFLHCEVENKEYVFAWIHFKSISIFHACGLSDLIAKLPIKLGNTTIDVHQLIGKLSTIAPDNHFIAPLEDDAVELSIFGVSTWTPILKGVDRMDCSLDICKELLALGVIPTCRMALAVLQKECQALGNKRGLLRIASLLADTYSSLHRPEGIISQIMSTRNIMNEAGDVLLFSEHISHLSLAYIDLNQRSMASELLSQSIDVIEKSIVLSLPNLLRQKKKSVGRGSAPHIVTNDDGSYSVLSSTQSELSTSLVPFQSMSQSQLRQSMGNSSSQLYTQTQSQTQAPNIFTQTISSDVKLEFSYESSIGLLTLLDVYIQLQLQEANNQMVEGEDPRSIIDALNDYYTNKTSILESIVGINCAEYAKSLKSKAERVSRFVLDLHRVSSAVVSIQSYSQWLDGTLQTCIQEYEKSADILRAFHAAVPRSDTIYLKREEPPPPQVPTAPTGKGKAAQAAASQAAAAAADNSVTQPVKTETVPLLSSHDFILAAVLHETAVLNMTLTILRREDVTIHDGSRDARQSVVDHYLEGTRARNAMVLTDFITPAAFKSMFCASSATRLLMHSNQRYEAMIYEHSAAIKNLTRSGKIDMIWTNNAAEFEKGLPGTRSPRKISQVGEPKIQLPTELLRSRLELQKAFSNTLENQRYSASAEAALALLSTYGHLDMKASAQYLIHFQSIRVREWLLNIWTQALSPTSSIAQTLGRLRSYERDLVPDPIIRQSIALDRAVMSTNICWKRLNVSKSPAEILQQTRGLVLLGVQLCPLHSTLHIYAGCDAVTSGTDSFWIVDKIHLFESTRRQLQTLKKQQKAWTDDVIKFTVQYNDSYTPELDEDATADPLKISDRLDLLDVRLNLSRAEHALIERLQALVKDLDAILQPLLGTESRCFKFMKRLQGFLPQTTTLMLLIDPYLQDLPWEALSLPDSLFRDKCSRDFSLHLLGHRFDTSLGRGHARKDSKERDSDSSVNLASVITPVVTSSGVQCVIDPFQEDKGNKSSKAPRDPMKSAFQKLKAKVSGGNKWRVLEPQGTAFSLQDWVDLSQPPVAAIAKKGAAVAPASGSQHSTTVFYNAPGRFGSTLEPKDLSVLNLEAVSLMFLGDLGYNDGSYRRQSSADIQKRALEISSERSLEVCALLSLCGVGCIVAHQWSTAFASQQRFVNNFWEMFTTRKDVNVLRAVECGNHLEIPQVSRPAAAPVHSISSKGSPGKREKSDHKADHKDTKSTKKELKSGASSKAVHQIQSQPVSPDPKEGASGMFADESVAETAVPVVEQSRPVKKWIAHARVVYGIPTVTYVDS